MNLPKTLPPFVCQTLKASPSLQRKWRMPWGYVVTSFSQHQQLGSILFPSIPLGSLWHRASARAPPGFRYKAWPSSQLTEEESRCSKAITSRQHDKPCFPEQGARHLCPALKVRRGRTVHLKPLCHQPEKVHTEIFPKSLATGDTGLH